MKYFSILFTVLFFLGFASTASAESIYTVTNKLDDDYTLSITLNIRPDYALDAIYIMRPNECVRVTASQFDDLTIYWERHGLFSFDSKFLCSLGSFCSPNNYELIERGFFERDKRKLQIVNQPNTSRGCINIERWMKNKEQEFLRNNPWYNSKNFE